MARRPTNPFYIPLVLIGVAFTISACGYFVMALRGQHQGPEALQAQPNRLMLFFDHFGAWVLTGELVLLAAATAVTIGSDDYWTRRRAVAESTAETTPS